MPVGIKATTLTWLAITGLAGGPEAYVIQKLFERLSSLCHDDFLLT